MNHGYPPVFGYWQEMVRNQAFQLPALDLARICSGHGIAAVESANVLSTVVAEPCDQCRSGTHPRQAMKIKTALLVLFALLSCAAATSCRNTDPAPAGHNSAAP